MAQRATKQHIMEATITAIEKYGVQNVTTRTIAQEAGVNNAALHYYYGTKDRLVTEALALTLDHMMQDTDAILSGEGDIRERLAALFGYIVEGILRYPNLIRAHLAGPLMQGENNSPFLGLLDAWLNRTSRELETIPTSTPAGGMRFAVYAAFSAILMAGLLPESAQEVISINLRDAAARTKAIESIVASLLIQAGKAGK
ncbi:MAG: TetR family transcriptional regulator [Anaerolineaceae bacterium]|nr:TetR family transcriptional regulator [Anaerolineaceae bacterium]